MARMMPGGARHGLIRSKTGPCGHADSSGRKVRFGSDATRREAALACTPYREQHIDRIALGVQVLDAPGGSPTQRLYFVRATDGEAARAVIEEWQSMGALAFLIECVP